MNSVSKGSVSWVEIDEASNGQRIDNFLVKTLKGVPRSHVYRILRTVKNRFGPTNEIGVFEMQQAGLVEVESPSELFLAERPWHASGSIVMASMEGTRPLLVELQALGSPSGFGAPRRVANGIDYQRMVLLLAVLEKRLGLPLQERDIYVNVVGGFMVTDRMLAMFGKKK